MTFEELIKVSPTTILKLGKARFVVSKCFRYYNLGSGIDYERRLWVKQVFNINDPVPDGPTGEFELPPNLWHMLEIVE